MFDHIDIADLEPENVLQTSNGTAPSLIRKRKLSDDVVEAQPDTREITDAIQNPQPRKKAKAFSSAGAKSQVEALSTAVHSPVLDAAAALEQDLPEALSQINVIVNKRKRSADKVSVGGSASSKKRRLGTETKAPTVVEKQLLPLDRYDNDTVRKLMGFEEKSQSDQVVQGSTPLTTCPAVVPFYQPPWNPKRLLEIQRFQSWWPSKRINFTRDEDRDPWQSRNPIHERQRSYALELDDLKKRIDLQFEADRAKFGVAKASETATKAREALSKQRLARIEDAVWLAKHRKALAKVRTGHVQWEFPPPDTGRAIANNSKDVSVNQAYIELLNNYLAYELPTIRRDYLVKWWFNGEEKLYFPPPFGQRVEDKAVKSQGDRGRL